MSEVKIEDGYLEGVGGPALREIGIGDPPHEELPVLRKSRFRDRIYRALERMSSRYPIKRRKGRRDH